MILHILNSEKTLTVRARAVVTVVVPDLQDLWGQEAARDLQVLRGHRGYREFRGQPDLRESKE